MMELQGEDGSIVELTEKLKKELGRGPGIAPHDRSVSRRQVRLQVQRVADHDVVIEVVGPNPICIVHTTGGDVEVEIVKPGTQSSLKIGDKFSLSIQAPVFYTLAARLGARGPHVSRHESTDSGKLVEDDQKLAADEEEGIAEAVARWQRRKQERLQADQRRPSTQEVGAGAILKDHGDRIGEQVGRKQAQDFSQQRLVYSKVVSHEANEPEQTRIPTTNEDDTDVTKKFGFIVEGFEFERYGKKGLDTSKWDWRIGRQLDSDDDEDAEGGGQQQLRQNGTASGPRTTQKGKLRKEDDDDDWRGDSEGEKELLSARKMPVPRKKNVQTRSQNLATTSETIVDPGKKRKLVSTSEDGSDVENPSIEQGKTKLSRQATASTSTKKTSKRQSRASKDEEEEDDDEEDLGGFLVDNVEEEDEEVADEEDEWTDEDKDEDEEVVEADEIDEVPSGAPAQGRLVMDKGDGGDHKPLCKYGNNCFRKNKDHLAQFRH